MRTNRPGVRSVFALLFSLVFVAVATGDELSPDTAARVESLVRQLNAETADQRDQAERELVKLAPTDHADQCDTYLQLLPKPVEGMPAEVQLRLARLRKKIETAQSSRALEPRRLTLSAQESELSELFDAIYEQTGNQLSDYREQLGQEASSRPVTIEINDEPFWPAVDKLLDAAVMTTYPFSGEKELAVINAEPNSAPRVGKAAYAGPFRVEAINIAAQRNLRSPDQQGARVELEFAWEPRLRPIALSQPVDDLEITADDGSQVMVDIAMPELNVEVQSGSHATEMTIPITLPPREVKHLASFKGRMSALVPGRLAEFQFDNLDQASNKSESRGGVTVVLRGVRRNQDLWEVHMRVKLESTEVSLESHRGWVFQNLTYMLNPQGELIDHAGFETTMQSESEVGLAYFFELPTDDISQYTWVYRTPAAIVRMPVEYEVKDIPLP